MTNPFGKPVEDDDDDVFEVEDVNNDGSYAIPEGVYKARVIDLVREESKAGNPMWVWTFLVLQGAESGLGKELKMWTALTPAAMWKLNETCRALELPADDNGRIRMSKKDIINRECAIHVEDSEFNGRTNSSIAKCESLSDAKVKGPKYENG